MKPFKKILSLFLIIAIVICAVPFGAFTFTASAATEYNEGFYTYTVSNGKATITDVDTSISGSITIPLTLGGYTVTSIGWGAFEDCTGLTSVTIPNNVASIGSYAFSGCTGLTNVTIGNGVTRIGWSAFEDCTGLKGVYISDIAVWCNMDFGSSSANPLYYAKNLYLNGELVTDLVIPDSVTSIGDYAFRGCTGLTNITIPDSVTSIGADAFSSCTGLTSVTIPDSVTSIGNYAFAYCTGLKSVTIGNSVTSIGNYAFSNCTGLTSVTIPNSVTSIGSSAFSGCTGLKGVYIGDIAAWCNIDFGNAYANPLYYAKNLYLNGELVTNLVIPDGVTSIGDDAFAYYTGLISVTIPDSITSIGDDAFAHCTGLTSVTIGNGVTSIGDDAFYGCDSLTSITIPDSVTGIGAYAFCGCTGLTSITIPSSVTSIDDYAFYNCRGLTSITIPDSVTSIGDDAFAHCTGLTSVTIPDSVTSIDRYAFYRCNNLESITLPFIGGSATENQFLGYIFGASSSSYNDDYVPSSLKTVIISDKCTSIPDYAFSSCTGLTSVTISNSVTSIGSSAFRNCSGLTSVTIPDSVINIDTDAFYGCNSTIICNPDSCAESYAKENSLNFIHFISNIKITRQPTKTQYYVGDKIDLSGLEVTAYYYDATNKIITDYTLGEYDGSVGKKEISVSYHGVSDTFFVEFLSVEAIGIEITSLPNKLSQNNEDVLDLTGLVVTVKYNNGSTQIINDYTVTGYDCTVGGTQTITVSYGGFSVSFEIEVLLRYHRGQCGDNANWTYDPETGELIIAGSGTMYDYDITGEGTVPWLENIGQIKVIEISDGITHIGSNAFVGCSGVKSITIPDSVESIGEFAFSNCGGMLNATFGNGLKSIGKEAFTDCTRLKRVYINDLANWCGIEFDTNANPLSNGGILYIDDIVANDIIIPDGVTAIAPNAFIGCVNIKNVTIPEGVTAIGKNAFWGCSSLATVSIPSSVQTVGERAFNLCEKLKNVYITDLSSWIKIDFENYNANPLCTAENLYIDGKLTRDLIIPDGTTEIAPFAFYTFSGFDYVYIPASVTTVGEDAFNFCNFETVEFAEGTELILKDTLPFFVSTGAHIIIPDSVVFIETDTISGTSTQIFGKIGSEAENYAIDNECQFYKTPVSIEVAQLPDRTTYYKESKNAMDYSFSTTGLKIKVTYYDGTTEILEDGFKILSRDYPYIQEMATGTHPVKIWFGGKITSFDITVYAKELTSIAITENPIKTEYILGEEFSHQGMTVTAYYKDGTSEHVQITADMISGFDSTTVGTKTIIVTYAGKTDTFRVSVVFHAATEHRYDNNCDASCNICGATRTPSAHKYDNTCDTTCNECGATRSITHTYSNNCDAECNVCGATRTPSAHVYDNSQDTTCNVCGAVREVTPLEWEISVTKTGVYTLKPNSKYTGSFSTNKIIVLDKSGNIVKFNESKGGFPLVADQDYTVKFNYDCSDDINGTVTWTKTRKADTIFTDVSSSEWYNDAVTYSVGRGIISGYGGTTKFGPGDNIQRQDFLVILARLDGVDLTSYGNKKSAFPDVPEGSYYEAAVNWGVEKGIVSGYQNGKFGTGDKITREQLVTFLYRYANYKGLNTSYTTTQKNKVKNTYTDYKNVTDYAVNPVIWAVTKGVINGKTTSRIVPGGNALRCEVAQIMYNIFKNDIF